MSLLSILRAIGSLISNKNASFVFKSNTEPEVKGENIKHIKSPHPGGYVYIYWPN